VAFVRIIPNEVRAVFSSATVFPPGLADRMPGWLVAGWAEAQAVASAATAATATAARRIRTPEC
jgi:hypothetical protein